MNAAIHIRVNKHSIIHGKCSRVETQFEENERDKEQPELGRVGTCEVLEMKFLSGWGATWY